MLFAFAEACIGIGLFVSGIILVTVGSLLYSNGAISLELLAACALLGATLGDHAGYYTGRLLGQRLLQKITSPRVQKALHTSERLLRNHGGFAIFIGRFVPAIRSVLPALIGISGFNRLRYTLLDFLACLLWALALGAIIAGVDRFI